MEAISQAVERGKDRGLTEQEIEAAVGEGMKRHERQVHPRSPHEWGAESTPIAQSIGVTGPLHLRAAGWAAGPAPTGAQGARSASEPRIYCDPEIGQ